VKGVRALASGGLKTFVFDLDGVIWVDRNGVPGAGPALTALRAAGHQILFASNNSARALATVYANIERRTGYVPDPDSVITSALAATRLVSKTGATCYVLGSQPLSDALAAAGVTVTDDHTAATAVVVGLDRDLSYERLTRAVLAVRAGADFYATNDDATYPMPNGQYPGAGAMVAAVERSSGRRAIVCGKPHEPIRDLVESRVERDDVWVVGDRPETDLALAASAGWGKILTLTGVTDTPAGLPAHLRPDVTIGSIAELPDLVRTTADGSGG